VSFAIDVNILLYASDEASRFHQSATTFVDSCASGPEVFCLAWPTIMAYLRIATHPSIFAAPLTPDDATANIEALMKLPHVRVLSEDDHFWTVYREAGQGLVVRGNLVSDLHLAALLLQHGVRTLYTTDADFRRFTFLSVKNPLREDR